MLRVTDDGRPLGRAVRWGMAGLLVVATLGASAMRGPAQAPAVDPKKAAAADAPPFDLSALPPSTKGFVAIRPAALATIPGMKPVVESLNRALKMQFQDLGCAPEFEVPLEAIEQIVVSADLSRISDEDRKRNGNDARHAVVFGLYLIRMRHDFDWPARLRQMSSILKWEEVNPGLFRCQSPLLGPSPITLRVRDARTLVMESDGRPREAETEHWGKAWQQVERAGIAIALDNRDGHWAKLVGDRLGEEVTPAAKALFEQTTHLVLGVNADEHASGAFATDSADEAAARATVETIEAVGTFVRAAMPQALTVSTSEQQRVWLRLAAELFERRPVQRDGTQVRAEGRSSVKIAQLTAQFFEELMTDDKKK